MLTGTQSEDGDLHMRMTGTHRGVGFWQMEVAGTTDGDLHNEDLAHGSD